MRVQTDHHHPVVGGVVGGYLQPLVIAAASLATGASTAFSKAFKRLW